ncbi:hypothetical protein IFM89_018782, partial [Coptis chinensis]
DLVIVVKILSALELDSRSWSQVRQRLINRQGAPTTGEHADDISQITLNENDTFSEMMRKKTAQYVAKYPRRRSKRAVFRTDEGKEGSI